MSAGAIAMDSSRKITMSLYKLCFHPGEVVEERALGLSGKNPGWEGFAKNVVSGYFNDADDFDKAAAILEKAKAKGVYFTLNPNNPALFARSTNRLKVPKASTSDKDIACIRWFPIDLDAKRPSDISSNDAELAAVEAKGKEIATWLEGELGFAKGIRARSGNGFHLMYRLPDLPNNDETHKMVVGAAAAIKAKFEDDQVEVDATVVNPARIWKLYGTTGRKGDETADRPHRKSALFPKQPETVDDVPITSLEKILELAALGKVAAGQPGRDRQPGADATTALGAAPPAPSTPVGMAKRFKEGTLGPLNLEAYLGHYGVKYTVKIKGAQTLYVLDHCLFNPDHTDGTSSIFVSPTGPLIYQCFHSSCQTKRWADARAKISGTTPIAKFCAGYDPDFKGKAKTGAAVQDGEVGMGEFKIQLYQDLLGPEGETSVPRPDAVAHSVFFEIRNDREVFVAEKMAQYIYMYLAPLVCTDGFFWRYKTGLWERFPRSKIVQYVTFALGKKANGTHIDNAIKVLTGLVNREEKEWPDHPEYVNLLNGTFDVKNMTLMPHSPDFGCRSILPVNFDEKAFSQKWEDFLKDIFPEDDNYEKRGLLMQFFGYCLMRSCKYQKALFCYGTGSNGKSTVINVLTKMVGEENTSSLTLRDLDRQFRTQLLQEKLVNMASETSMRDPVATEVLKQSITGDMITVERKHGPPWQFRPYAKFLISMNDAPVIPDKSHGFARRIAVLGFNRRIEKEEMITDMDERLYSEIDGVFNWAVQGLRYLIKNNGFVLGETIKKETDRMMEVLNPLLIFVNELAWIRPGEMGCKTTDAWDAYRAWCNDGKNRPLGRNKFLDQITQTFPTVERKLIRPDPDSEEKEMRFIGFGLTNNTMQWLVEDVRQRKQQGWTRAEKGDD